MYYLNKAMEMIDNASNGHKVVEEDLGRIRNILWHCGLDDGTDVLNQSIFPYHPIALDVINSLRYIRKMAA